MRCSLPQSGRLLRGARRSGTGRTKVAAGQDATLGVSGSQEDNRGLSWGEPPETGLDRCGRALQSRLNHISRSPGQRGPYAQMTGRSETSSTDKPHRDTPTGTAARLGGFQSRWAHQRRLLPNTDNQPTRQVLWRHSRHHHCPTHPLSTARSEGQEVQK